MFYIQLIVLLVDLWNVNKISISISIILVKIIFCSIKYITNRN